MWRKRPAAAAPPVVRLTSRGNRRHASNRVSPRGRRAAQRGLLAEVADLMNNDEVRRTKPEIGRSCVGHNVQNVALPPEIHLAADFVGRSFSLASISHVGLSVGRSVVDAVVSLFAPFWSASKTVAERSGAPSDFLSVFSFFLYGFLKREICSIAVLCSLRFCLLNLSIAYTVGRRPTNWSQFSAGELKPILVVTHTHSLSFSPCVAAIPRPQGTLNSAHYIPHQG